MVMMPVRSTILALVALLLRPGDATKLKPQNEEPDRVQTFVNNANSIVDYLVVEVFNPDKTVDGKVAFWKHARGFITETMGADIKSLLLSGIYNPKNAKNSKLTLDTLKKIIRYNASPSKNYKWPTANVNKRNTDGETITDINGHPITEEIPVTEETFDDWIASAATIKYIDDDTFDNWKQQAAATLLAPHFEQTAADKAIEETILADFFVARAVVKRDGEHLKSINEALKADRDVVLAAVTSCRYALKFADETLRADRAFVLAAVTQHGYAMKFADEKLLRDRAFVLAAVEITRAALLYADKELRADPGFVRAAMKTNGDALLYADGEFGKDRTVVLAAASSKYGNVLDWADEEF